jgi:hypothetical protein
MGHAVSAGMAVFCVAVIAVWWLCRWFDDNTPM